MKNQFVTATQERITIRHVAQDAGVSVAAVSKVLRNAYGVSEVLRSKVEASIEKLNYRPSVAARGCAAALTRLAFSSSSYRTRFSRA